MDGLWKNAVPSASLCLNPALTEWDTIYIKKTYLSYCHNYNYYIIIMYIDHLYIYLYIFFQFYSLSNCFKLCAVKNWRQFVSLLAFYCTLEWTVKVDGLHVSLNAWILIKWKSVLVCSKCEMGYCTLLFYLHFYCWILLLKSNKLSNVLNQNKYQVIQKSQKN